MGPSRKTKMSPELEKLLTARPDDFRRLGIAQLALGAVCSALQIGILVVTDGDYGSAYYFNNLAPHSMSYVPFGIFVGLFCAGAGGVAFHIAMHLNDVARRAVSVEPKVKVYRYLSGIALGSSLLMGAFNAYLAKVTSDWFGLCISYERIHEQALKTAGLIDRPTADELCRSTPGGKYGLFIMHLFLALATLVVLVTCIIALTRLPAYPLPCTPSHGDNGMSVAGSLGNPYPAHQMTNQGFQPVQQPQYGNPGEPQQVNPYNGFQQQQQPPPPPHLVYQQQSTGNFQPAQQQQTAWNPNLAPPVMADMPPMGISQPQGTNQDNMPGQQPQYYGNPGYGQPMQQQQPAPNQRVPHQANQLVQQQTGAPWNQNGARISSV